MRKICQSDFDSQPGVTASPSGWMNGCMSVVLRSFFSYQVAVGRMMSEYAPVELRRKLMATIRSSLPVGRSLAPLHLGAGSRLRRLPA